MRPPPPPYCIVWRRFRAATAVFFVVAENRKSEIENRLTFAVRLGCHPFAYDCWYRASTAS